MVHTSKIKLLFFIVLAIYFLSEKLIAQVYFGERIELSTRDQFSHKKVIPIGENGVIIQSINTKNEQEHKVLKFDHYDTALNLKGTIKHLLQKDLTPYKVTNQLGQLHSVFHNNIGDFTIVSIDNKTFKKTHITGKLKDKGIIDDLIFSGDQVYFYATTWNSNYLYSVHLKTGKTVWKKIIPFSFKLKHFDRVKLFPSNSNDSLYFFVANDSKTKDYVLKKFGQDLDESPTFAFPIEKISTYFIKDIEIIDYTDGNPKIFGTYAIEASSKGSDGVFFLKDESSTTSYHSFKTCVDFWSFLPKKLKLKKEKKEEDSYDMKLITSYLITDFSETYFVTEFYYPSHYPEFFNFDKETGDVKIGETVRNEKKQFTHFILWKFDDEGNVLYSKQINYWPSYRSITDENNIVLEAGIDHVNILYPDRYRIGSYQLDINGEVVMAENEQPIELNNEEDIPEHTVTKLDFWYDGTFLLYGYQQLTNETLDKTDREVFYLSKVGF